LGKINPNLYQVAAASPAAFHRITTGSNGVYCQPTTPPNTPVLYSAPLTVSWDSTQIRLAHRL
jgi:hypothetical protein